MAVQYLKNLLYGISHGFDITLGLLLMAWISKDILRIFFQICIGNTHSLYNLYFTHNVDLNELVFSYGIPELICGYIYFIFKQTLSSRLLDTSDI